MNIWLLIYLIGVILMVVLVAASNRHSNPKNWKLKAILKTLLLCLGSWIMIFVVAYKEIVD